MDAAPRPPLFATLPSAMAEVYDPAAPWALLRGPLDLLFAALPGERIDTAIGPDVIVLGHHIVIGKGTRIDPGVLLEGPVYVGEDVLIRAGASLRGGVWLEDGAVVGANCAVERAVFLEDARASRMSCVGGSILGAHVRLGAGTILATSSDNPAGIASGPIDKQAAPGPARRGALLGDRVETGAGAILDPDCTVGCDTRIEAGVRLRRGVYPAARRIRLRQQIEVVARHAREL